MEKYLKFYFLYLDTMEKINKIILQKDVRKNIKIILLFFLKRL